MSPDQYRLCYICVWALVKEIVLDKFLTNIVIIATIGHRIRCLSGRIVKCVILQEMNDLFSVVDDRTEMVQYVALAHFCDE